jgi:hypothetical protein
MKELANMPILMGEMNEGGKFAGPMRPQMTAEEQGFNRRYQSS